MGSVLVVEDDRGCCLSLAALIRRAGHGAKTACSAKEALGNLELALAGGSLPDLLIIDIEMPEMDGLTFLKKLRDQPQTQYLPVIVFTACSDPAVISEAQQLGACEYWVKARFDFTELPRRLNRYIAAAGRTETSPLHASPRPRPVPSCIRCRRPFRRRQDRWSEDSAFGSNAGID